MQAYQPIQFIPLTNLAWDHPGQYEGLVKESCEADPVTCDHNTRLAENVDVGGTRAKMESAAE